MANHRAFRPLPLLSNPHLQTVLGNLLSWTRDRHAATMRTVPLPDGDALAIHDSAPASWQSGGPIAVLVHGLAGCHRSGYMRRIANRLTVNGVRVVRLDLRGAGAGMKLARKFYNAACSPDIRTVIEVLHREHPSSPIVLLGFSLGGNIVLRLAAEAAAQPVAGLVAVGAVAPPIDLVRCSELISRQPFYDRFYVRQLIGQVQEHGRHFPDLPGAVFPAGATLRDFDEVYTAPRWQFASALDYYTRASAHPLIPSICLPCLIVTSRDDPFVALAPFEEATPGPGVTIDITPHGGHLGFLGGDGAGGIRWAETRVISWALGQLDDCQRTLRPS